MKKNWKRLGALLLTLVMVLSMVPATALAAGEDAAEVLTDAADNSRDVGVTGGTYSNTNSSAVHAWASSQQGASSGDGPATWAVDGNENSHWHSRYNDNGITPAATDAENTDQTTTANAGWKEASMADTDTESRLERRWIELDIRENDGAAQWLSGLRYKGRNDNGDVLTCEIRVWDETNSAWVKVTSDAAWTIGDGRGTNWSYKAFDCPVQTSKVRLYGVTTTSAGQNKNMCAREIRLVKAANKNPTTHNATITVNNTKGAPVGGAAVVIAGQKATTNASGEATVKLIDGRGYTGTVTAADHGDGTVTITGGENAAGTVALQAMERTISGKVTTDGTTPVVGAKVELVNTNYAKVANGPETTTGDDGTYSLNVNSLAAGSYKVRVSKDDHGAKILDTAIVVVATELTESHPDNDVQLPAIVTKDGDYSWDFSASDRPGASDLDYISTNDTVQVTYSDDDQMKLSWKTNKRDDNLVRIVDTNTKDFVIEFDATRLAPESGTASATKNARFGLAIRAQGDKTGAGQYWIYVGQTNEGKWGAELFRTTESGGVVTTKSGGWHDGDVSGSGKPTFTEGETRHFKVVASGLSVALYVDGIAIFETDNVKTFCGKTNGSSVAITADDVNAAGDIGFLWGQDYDYETNKAPHSIEIDNLYVLRNDPKNVLTLGEFANGTVTAKYTENSKDYPITSGTTLVPNGALVTVTGTPSNADTHVLDSVTVARTGEGDAVSVTPTLNGNVATFNMPNAPVTVTGKFLPKVTGVSISGTEKVNKTLTAAVTPEDADGKVTYQWYHLNNEGQTGEAWVACTSTGSNTKTKTVSAEDQGKKVKVVVTGNGTDYAATVSAEAISSGVMAAADVETSGVSIERTAITMWTNHGGTSSDNTDEGSTTTVTATVSPSNATNKTIAWTSSNETVATVDQNGLVTAVANGTATIKAEVTSANGTKVSDTVTINVKTKVASITVKKGETPVAEGGSVKVYINDGIDDAPRSVTLIGTVAPTNASDKTLTWSRTGGSTGKINIQPAGSSDSDPDSATSSGSGVTISAVGTDSKNVGEVTVKVAAADGLGAETTFKVEVWRKLAHEVTIGGDAKFGETLEVNTDSLDMTAAGKAALTYQWKRDGEGISGATSKTYELVEADIGKTISVVVTAGANTYYEGSKTASTATVVAKADAPAAPTLSKTDVDGDTKGTVTITDPVNGETYEYRKKTSDSPETWGEWTTDNLANNVISNLEAGDYQVRIQENTTHKAGTEETITVGDVTKIYYNVTVAMDPATGAGTAVRSATTVEKGKSVTLTVTPAAAYNIKSVKNGEETLTGTAGENGAMVYTVSNVQAAVAFAVTFEKKQVTITLALTNLTATCNVSGEEDHGTSHTVDYGAVTTITLKADDGYELPESITVTYTDPDDTATAPGTRWNYDSDTGVITFTYGTQKNITITAEGDAKTYTVEFTATGGNLDLSGDETEVAYDTTFSGTLTVKNAAQYSLPETITVTMGDQTLAAGTDYTYDSSTGAISIPNVTGDVTITATAVANTTPLTAVTIAISHTDESTDEQTIPHVGDTLRANPVAGETTTGITASYQWYLGDEVITGLQDATRQSYVVREGDVGKTIKVKATGTGDYSGEVTSAATNAVKEKTVKTTGISLDQSAASVEFGKTLTLVATVEPEDATDKTVTWTSSNEAAATVDENGVVTAVGVGSATITATDSAGHDDTCEVTVTAAQVSVKLTGVAKVGETLTATITPTGATTRSITWYRVGENDAAESLNNTDNLIYTPVAADAGYKIKVTVQGTGNYDGTASATTAKEVVGENEELPANAITVADDIANGTVTADPTSATAGTTVTLTVTPDEGYKLDTLTVTGESGEVEVTDNTFVMPDEAVTVTATFVEDGEEPPVTVDPTGVSLNKTTASVQVGKNTTLTATLEPAGATGELTWGSDDEEIATVDENGKVTGVAEGTANITVTVDGTEFTATCEVTVTKATSGGSVGKQPSASTSTNNPDGSTTTTVTNPDGSKTSTTEKPDGTKETVETKKDGTKTETTEKPDGTKEVVETKPDGTVIETTEKPDGTKETVKTQPDGTVMEIVVAPDGTKESVETKPDGTKTETVIDTEGAMTEKVTDPEENVTITVTDAEGEELAKVELPATIPAPETKFEDVPEAHWAEDAINTVAGLGLVKGVDGNRYDMTTAMDRGSLATILYRLSNGKSGYKASFTDVAEDKYYSEGVAWAAKVGVVTGFSKDIFAPEQIITREQLAVMLARYAKLIGMDTKAETSSLNTFTDGDKTGTWAADSMAWCIEAGILRGKGGNVLDPKADVSRAEVAVMLERFIGLMK